MLTSPVSHSRSLLSSHPETEQNLQRQLQEAAIRAKVTAIPAVFNIGIMIGSIATSIASGKENARLVILGGFCVNVLWNVGVHVYNDVKRVLVTEKIHQIQLLQATQQSSANFDPDATP